MRVKITIVIGLVASGLWSCSFEEKLQKKKDDSSSSSDATPAAGRFKDAQYLCVPEETAEEEEEEAELHLADAVTWDGQISKLVTDKCVVCHNTGGVPFPPDLSTFELNKTAGPDSLQQIVDGLMPQGAPLKDAEVAQFQAWADGGYQKGVAAEPAPSKTPPKADDDALEADRCPVPADEPESDDEGDDDDGSASLVSYKDVKALIDGKCVACHGAGGKPYAPDLTGYANAKAGGERSNVRIQEGTMPTTGALSADEQALFQKWVDGGYAEKGN